MIEEHHESTGTDVPANGVWVQRYTDSPECDVIVAFRGREMALRCRDYNQAVQWARIECKAYRLPDDFAIVPAGKRE
jgi:hypothetical protein